MKRFLMLVCIGSVALAAPAAATARGHARLHGHRSVAVSAYDRWYFVSSAQTDLAEIQGGTAALTKSTNPAIVKLAQTLVSDHTALLNSKRVLARKLGIRLPTAPSPTQQWEAQILSTLSGAQFNHWFATNQIAGHEQAIQETVYEIAYGRNVKIRAAARSALPMLRMHLALAEAAAQANP